MQNVQHQPIWNPSRVASFSFLFTPVFGSYLQSANWRAMGQSERAASSRIWFFISLLVLAVMGAATVLFAGKSASGNDAVRGIVNLGGLAYFLLWYCVSGRRQVRFVKVAFGKEYAKKSMVKPVLLALLCVFAYAAVIFGLLMAVHWKDDDGDAAQQQASSASQGSSPGPLSALSGLLATGPKLDCAAESVKQTIADDYADQLMQTGIPDLIWAVSDKHIKVRVDTVREVARNNQSKNADCAANLVIDFPGNDLERARQQGEIFAALMQTRGYAPLTTSTFQAGITYQVAVPADAGEKKQGLIVTMTTHDDRATDRQLKTFATYYEALSLSQPDINVRSANATPWSKEFRENAIQSCSQSMGVEKCTCRMDTFAKVMTDLQMAQITFTMQDGPILAKQYVNFTKLATALNQQCPMTQSLASVFGADGASAGAAIATSETTQPPAAQQAAQPASVLAQAPQQVAVTTPDSAQPSQTQIVASFDCAKASSKTEKLICSSSQTADADRRLAATYRVAASKATDQAALRQQQREWLTKERNACNDAACLVNVTEARIQALSAM
ncbi:lysozyme inhibitor LprI family protein [Paraburkholderia strydomiana]|uniref:lysozyme inhibitor LprI family protein n=1 Tax=Paraburkholderia strydomiana TaxID=1245417 RepID=UPI0038BB189D